MLLVSIDTIDTLRLVLLEVLKHNFLQLQNQLFLKC